MVTDNESTTKYCNDDDDDIINIQKKKEKNNKNWSELVVFPPRTTKARREWKGKIGLGLPPPLLLLIMSSINI